MDINKIPDDYIQYNSKNKELEEFNKEQCVENYLKYNENKTNDKEENKIKEFKDKINDITKKIKDK